MTPRSYAASSPVSAPLAEDRAERFEHLLLALADALGLEPHEAALLRRQRGRLRRLLQPLAELTGLLRRRLLDEQRVDGAQLALDLLTGVGAARLEAGHRVVAVAGPIGEGLRARPGGIAAPAPLRPAPGRPPRGRRLLYPPAPAPPSRRLPGPPAAGLSSPCPPRWGRPGRRTRWPCRRRAGRGRAAAIPRR